MGWGIPLLYRLVTTTASAPVAVLVLVAEQQLSATGAVVGRGAEALEVGAAARLCVSKHAVTALPAAVACGIACRRSRRRGRVVRVPAAMCCLAWHFALTTVSLLGSQMQNKAS